LNKKLIELNRELYKLPTHTRVLAQFSEKFLAFPESVQLAKKWCQAHMFSDYLREELIELLVAHGFSSPYPYEVPETPIVGFQRFISLLSTFDWSSNPLFVKVTFDEKDGMDVLKKYNTLQSKPPMYVVSSYNSDQNVPYWTRPDEPSFLVFFIFFKIQDFEKNCSIFKRNSNFITRIISFK
jgi:U3 small nucleolar RNA-associated protein 22